MQHYILRRLLAIIPTVLLITIIVFFLVHLIPGNVVEQILADVSFTAGDDAVAKVTKRLGLDRPLYERYFRWLTDIVIRGDLGISLFGGEDVGAAIAHALPVSIELGILSIAISLLIAMPVGIYSGIRQDTGGDYVARSFAILMIAVPSFWLATLIMVFPAIWWRWTPPLQYIPFMQDPIGNIGMFIIPSLIMGMFMSGTTMRMTRTMMLEVMRQDYVRTAWSKGLRERKIVTAHALKNALIPVVTIVGIQVPVLVGGSVVIEQIFNLPGIGRLTLETLASRDYMMLSGINLIVAVSVLFINLIVDLSYSYLDPRVRYQ